MDKFESWMINLKYLLKISYDINSYTYLTYWWKKGLKYAVPNQKMLIVLMSVLLYTLSLVPVRSWFVRMSHMPKKTSSREWVWWAPVCTVHQVPQRHSHKQAQTDIRTEHEQSEVGTSTLLCMVRELFTVQTGQICWLGSTRATLGWDWRYQEIVRW